MKSKLENHEYANIYRMMSDDDLQSLAEDIKNKGQLLPITTYEGRILDGRNRYKACAIAGTEPRMDDYSGDDPLSLISSLNDHRRHDTTNERALVGARMANLRAGGDRGNQHTGGKCPMGHMPNKPAVTIERAAELSGASQRNIRRAKSIVNTGIPELQDMADSGEVSIRAASEVSKLTEAEQHKAISGGVQGVIDAARKKPDAKPDEKPTRTRLPKWKPNDADRLWLMAKQELNKILSSDESRDRVLHEVIAYAKNRIQTNK
tara:strand:- start:1160 stop:1948 length:789 start_codon:yes stop_codon:yes gene_type:complete